MPRPRLNADPSMATLVEPPLLPPRLTPLEVRELKQQVIAARADARRGARFPSSLGTARELKARADRLEAAFRVRKTRQVRF